MIEPVQEIEERGVELVVGMLWVFEHIVHSISSIAELVAENGESMDDKCCKFGPSLPSTGSHGILIEQID